MAEALECDPAFLFKLALEQLGGDTTASVIDQIFGTIVTRNEVIWLDEIRDASNNSDPNLTTKARGHHPRDIWEMTIRKPDFVTVRLERYAMVRAHR